MDFARLYRLFIPARPIHLAVFGAAAIAVHVLGGVRAETAMTAAILVVIVQLIVTIALDFIWPPSPYTTRRC